MFELHRITFVESVVGKLYGRVVIAGMVAWGEV